MTIHRTCTVDSVIPIYVMDVPHRRNKRRDHAAAAAAGDEDVDLLTEMRRQGQFLLTAAARSSSRGQRDIVDSLEDTPIHRNHNTTDNERTVAGVVQLEDDTIVNEMTNYDDDDDDAQHRRHIQFTSNNGDDSHSPPRPSPRLLPRRNGADADAEAPPTTDSSRIGGGGICREDATESSFSSASPF